MKRRRAWSGGETTPEHENQGAGHQEVGDLYPTIRAKRQLADEHAQRGLAGAPPPLDCEYGHEEDRGGHAGYRGKPEPALIGRRLTGAGPRHHRRSMARVFVGTGLRGGDDLGRNGYWAALVGLGRSPVLQLGLNLLSFKPTSRG